MMIMDEDVRHAMQQVGANGAQFQFKDVREKLGVSASERNEVARIFNAFKSMEESGEIQEVPTGRKRNRIYKSVATTSTSAADRQWDAHSSQDVDRDNAPDRLTRMEKRLEGIERSLIRIGRRLQELGKILR